MSYQPFMPEHEPQPGSWRRWVETDPTTSTAIPYFIFGEKPTTAILFGIHGDEYGSIHALGSILKKTQGLFGDFLFVPRASPSALATRTLTNAWGHNVNRMFLPDHIDDPEAHMLSTILQKHGPFKTLLTCHEDWERTNETYLYRTSRNNTAINLEALRTDIRAVGAIPFTGIDAVDDPILGFQAEEGFIAEMINECDGSLEAWVYLKNLADDVLTIEIPMHGSPEIKRSLYEVFFHHLILPDTLNVFSPKKNSTLSGR